MRSLKLSKETLAELTADEMIAVVGGISGLSCLNCGSDFQQCITGIGCLRTRVTC